MVLCEDFSQVWHNIYFDSYQKVAVRDISTVCSLGYTCVIFSQLEMFWLDVFSMLSAEQSTPRFCTMIKTRLGYFV